MSGFVSADHGAPYPSDFDGTFLSDEEKQNYIEENCETVPIKHSDEEITYYFCPTCNERHETIEGAMECHPDDVKE